MFFWVDADSCPRQVRDLIGKTAERRGITARFVANRSIPLPSSKFCEMILSAATPDAADDYIVDHADSRDLVVTRDIPLAKRLVDKGIRVINDRGNVYTELNINERLSMRNLMLELFNNGITPEKTGQFGRKELQDFANALDREVTKLTKATEAS